MKKTISESTIWETGNLLHTISVECSYTEMEDAKEEDAVTFVATTKGEANGANVDDLDYAVQCSIDDAREFARYILSLCDDIELSKR